MTAPHHRRAGLTLIETTVGLALVGLLATLLGGLHRNATLSADRTGADLDATRIALGAVESLRRDASHLIYQLPADLVIPPAGNGISMLVPVLGSDLWSTGTVAVTYRLERLPGEADAYALVRTQGDERPRTIAAPLKAIQIRYLPRGGASALRSYLEITAVALSPGGSRATAVASAVVPVDPATPPRPYVRSRRTA